MLNAEQILNRIKTMPKEMLVAMVREALTESGIPFETGHGQIEYYGLSLCFECQTSFALQLNAESPVHHYAKSTMLNTRAAYTGAPISDSFVAAADSLSAAAA